METSVTTEISVWRRSSGNAVALTSAMLSDFKEQHAGVYANKALVHRSLDYMSIDMKGFSLHICHLPPHTVMSHHHPWSSLNMIHHEATTSCPGLSSCVIFSSTYILYISYIYTRTVLATVRCTTNWQIGAYYSHPICHAYIQRTHSLCRDLLHVPRLTDEPTLNSHYINATTPPQINEPKALVVLDESNYKKKNCILCFNYMSHGIIYI